MTSELRPAVEVWREAYSVWGDPSLPDTSEADQAAAAVIEADREAVRAPLLAEIERLRGGFFLIATGGFNAKQCRQIAREGMARAALGDSHDQ